MKKLPNIHEDFSEWYNEVVYQAELADLSPVRGSLVIRPYGYSIWENIKDILDKKIKATGHQNAAFPLFIPKSFIEREAKHVEGFAPELAIVTHAGGKELDEPLVVRPTSETIIHYMFAQWIKSWRDLPLKINQWANVVRWEMRTRPFLRTCEFFWQEGHTAHATAQEAEDEALLMLHEYLDLYQNYLAIPAIAGIKSESERFAGADKTYTIEGVMQDGKALQMATSHLISQNFAKTFGMTFQNQEGSLSYPYLTSWGLTTRSVGAVIMVHGDAKGLVLPPKIAPIQTVIIPILKKGIDTRLILQEATTLYEKLSKAGIRVFLDAREDETPGAKFYHWELKGVPTKIEIGPKDIEQGSVILADRLGLAKEVVPNNATLADIVQQRLAMVHKEMFARAQKRLQEQWYRGEKIADFGKDLEDKSGIYQTGWCGSALCEQEAKKYKATIRCLLKTHEFNECFYCSQKSKFDIMLAKAY